jgi:hypothetical protein
MSIMLQKDEARDADGFQDPVESAEENVAAAPERTDGGARRTKD